MNIGLYIHFPFCKRKCNYCDFYSVTADPDRIRRYADALIVDMEKQAPQFSNETFDTLFIGGGTPSVGGVDMVRILNRATQLFNFTPDAEMTCEANPESITEEWILQMKSAGINRISMGAQSFCDAELMDLGRIHDKRKIYHALEIIRKCGIENINIDLMFGIAHRNAKNDHFEAFSESLSEIIQLDIPHISCYNLTVMGNTPLQEHLQEYSFPDEDTEEKMYRHLCKRLGECGYEHYEISNFAKDGYECKHNLKYWASKPYLGFGPSAHSFINNVRYSCQSNVDDYIMGHSRIQIEEKITPNQYAYERLVMGLRTKNGVKFSEIEPFFDLIPLKNALNLLEKQGFLLQNDEKFALNERGFRVSNTIISQLGEYFLSDR